MFKYFWFFLAFATAAYAMYGIISGEVTIGSTSKINGKEIKLTGMAALAYSLCALSAAAAFAGLGASQIYTEHAALFDRITKIGLFATVACFLGTVVIVVLK
ncbi:MAG: hypothetical protein K8S54_13075 [Spirochaetia bacterium]|nr:hypothetical protein [Spirochaetia bacterium]